MVIIDTRSNSVHSNLTKTQAGMLLGVNRATVARWVKKREQDGTFKEVYNTFEVYFREVSYKKRVQKYTVIPG